MSEKNPNHSRTKAMLAEATKNGSLAPGAYAEVQGGMVVNATNVPIEPAAQRTASLPAIGEGKAYQNDTLGD